MFENLFNILERKALNKLTNKTDGQTDGQTDGRIFSFWPLFYHSTIACSMLKCCPGCNETTPFSRQIWSIWSPQQPCMITAKWISYQTQIHGTRLMRAISSRDLFLTNYHNPPSPDECVTTTGRRPRFEYLNVNMSIGRQMRRKQVFRKGMRNKLSNLNGVSTDKVICRGS